MKTVPISTVIGLKKLIKQLKQQLAEQKAVASFYQTQTRLKTTELARLKGGKLPRATVKDKRWYVVTSNQVNQTVHISEPVGIRPSQSRPGDYRGLWNSQSIIPEPWPPITPTNWLAQGANTPRITR